MILPGTQAGTAILKKRDDAPRNSSGYSVCGENWRLEYNVRFEPICLQADRAQSAADLDRRKPNPGGIWIESAMERALAQASVLRDAIGHAEPGTELGRKATRQLYPLPSPAERGYPDQAYA